MRGFIPFQERHHSVFFKTSKALPLAIFLLTFFFIFNLSAQCPGGSGVIGGQVFGDYNFNGQNDQVGGIRGVKVNLYGCDNSGASVFIQSTYSNFNGDYFFSGLQDGAKFKVEFETPAGHYPGFGGNDFGSGIQFVTAPDCNINTSFAAPEDFYEHDPVVVTTCFINGDPLAPGFNGAGSEVLVGFPWSSKGQRSPPSKYGTAGEYGSIYGIAYDRFDKLLFTSAFLKRHVGIGTEGLGGIYVLDASGTVPSQLLSFNLNDLGINVGSIPSNSARGLAVSTALPSNDSEAYAKVGKVGIGAIDVDYAGEYLYVINLFEKKLHKIDINNLPIQPTSSDVTTYNLPASDCAGGDYRPFAVKYYRGDIYIGGICDAAGSQQTSDLTASVHKLAGNSFEQVVSFDLDFPKGIVTMHADCENYPGWYPWTDQIPASCDGGSTIVYPQPILSDMEFDVDGSVILGFSDRLGHQLGFKNYPLTGNSPLLTNVSGGDLIRVNREDDGSYTLENNGKAGEISTGGVGNGEGPGNGEFYYRDVFEGGLNNIIPPAHSETSQGGIAFSRGSGHIATTALDPYSIAYNTGGVNWMDNRTGAIRDNEGYQLYRTSSSNIATFAKANGLGDLLALPSLAPNQTGGMVWIDVNADGIQDGCEGKLSGIEVSLFGAGGNFIAKTTTDANGEYYFDSEYINRNSKYYFVFGTGGGYDTNTRKLNSSYFYTLENVGNDFHDSDITIADNSILGGAIDKMPFITFNTGTYGYVDHSLDAGFSPEDLHPTGTVGGYVWDDFNENGIQDAGEDPRDGVVVQLMGTGGNIVATTSTDVNGNYSFPGLDPGSYQCQFSLSSGFEWTLQNQGNGSNDSDVNPLTGTTPVMTLDPANNGDLSDVDAGMFARKGGLIGFVFKDCDQDGIFDTDEKGIEGIEVELSGSGLNVFTSSSGEYSFANVPAGNYSLIFNIPSGKTGLIFTDKNQGNDPNRDSDVDIDGMTDIFTLNIGETVDNLFAGIQDVEAPELHNIPVDITIDLTTGGVVPGIPSDITATDNCDSDPKIHFKESRESKICGYNLLRVWTAVDECGNSSSGRQFISVEEGCACPGTKISGTDISPACGSVGGTVTINTTGDFSEYDFLWIPNRGRVGSTSNQRTDLPVGTYLVILEHKELDNCNDKVYLEVIEDCLPTPDTFNFSLRPNESFDFCQPIEELTGDVFLQKITFETGANNVNASSIEGSECMTIAAEKSGKTVINFEVCDLENACTESILEVLIEEGTPLAKPVAEPDYFTLDPGKTFDFDVCKNDSIEGDYARISVLNPPQIGVLEIHADNSMSYTPEEEQCGELTFTYELCNSAGCDYSDATLDVMCKEVLAMSGFSPNGDGVNDYFEIRGLDNFKNEVQVFNRWGSLVFKQKQYKNDWAGESNGGKLPSGIYFYVIKYGVKNKASGYVMIHN